MKRFHKYGIVGIVLLGMLLLLGTTFYFARIRHQIQILPNGTRLELATVTYGKKHEVRMPPANLQEALHLSNRGVSIVTTQSDLMALWLSSHLPESAKPKVEEPDLLAGQWNRIKVTDDTGRTMTIASSGGRMSTSMGGDAMVTLPFMRFPRRSKKLQFAFLKSDEEAPVARFTVENPVQGPFPDWKPEPVPILKTAGRLTVQLVRFDRKPLSEIAKSTIVGAMQDEALNQKIEGIKALETEGVPEPEGMVLTFQVSGGTPAPPNILLDHFSLSDPTGNVSSFDYSVASMMDGMLILSRKKPAEPSVTLLSDVGGMVNYWIVQSSPGPPSSNRVLPDGTITVLVINPPCPGETVFRTRLRLLEAQGISSRDQKLARRDEFEFTVALPPRSHD